jgi:hypothetical protein
VNDDGLPQGGALTTEWSLLNGPAVVSFDPNEFVLNPTAQLSLYGVYQFQLFADDGAATNQDVATVTYEEFECSGYPLADLDGNCRVDLTDLLIFTELWLRDESW